MRYQPPHGELPSSPRSIVFASGMFVMVLRCASTAHMRLNLGGLARLGDKFAINCGPCAQIK